VNSEAKLLFDTTPENTQWIAEST